MKVTLDEKLRLDLRDLQRICNGLEEYAKLDVKGTMDRIRAHREEAFCEISDYCGTRKVHCTRDAYDAILEMAARHRDSLPVPDDYSVSEVIEGICHNLARAIVDETDDESVLARVLTTAIHDANQTHTQRTFHFPCVLVKSQHPDQFSIGPVLFTAATAFPQLFASQIQEYLDDEPSDTYALERVERFKQHILAVGWVASIEIPSCGKAQAKQRAEVAVTTAINVLRLFFGIPHARDMRLVHTANATPGHSDYAITANGKMAFGWSRESSGAIVDKDWYIQLMTQGQSFWSHAAHLVATTVLGTRSETANRLIDAIGWFGKAAFEDKAGSKVIDLVAALERLTGTDWFHIHNFCARVAILAREDDSDLERCYWEAYHLHNTRSAVVHGAFSPSSPIFLKRLEISQELTRYALFRGMEIHCFLDDAGGMSKLTDLQKFFIAEQSRHASVLTKLRPQIGAREAEKKKLTSAEDIELFLART